MTKAFDRAGSTDSDGKVTLYSWNFGDGTLSEQAKTFASHTYKHAGTYKVSLTVTDNAGCSVPMIWTGQMAYCDGNKASTITHAITVK